MTSSLAHFDSVADRIRQHRQVSAEPVVVVEGPDDLLILGPHLEGTAIFPANGKPNVLTVSEKLLEWQIANFVGVIDVDFDDPVHSAHLIDQLYPYDNRDLEAMLVGLGVLQVVMEYQGSREKIEQGGGAKAIIDRLFASANVVAALRAANARERWSLPFDKGSIAAKCDLTDATLDVKRYCASLVQLGGSEVNLADVVQAASEPLSDDYGPRGRDVIELAGVALRRVAGSRSHSATKEEVLTPQVHSAAAFYLAKSDWLAKLHLRLAQLKTA